ncbi:MAG: hypothetical protein GX204_02255 [Acholeplasmataceae bacterium]|nr:hypothetical protein [Acholeplasmataceae bacterium]
MRERWGNMRKVVFVWILNRFQKTSREEKAIGSFFGFVRHFIYLSLFGNLSTYRAGGLARSPFNASDAGARCGNNVRHLFSRGFCGYH